MAEFWTDPETNTKYEVCDATESPLVPGVYKVLRQTSQKSQILKIYYSKWTGRHWLLVANTKEDAEFFSDTQGHVSCEMYDSSFIKGWLKEVEAPKDTSVPNSGTSVSKIVSLMIEENDIDSAIAFLNAMKNNSVVETAQVLLAYLEKKCSSK